MQYYRIIKLYPHRSENELIEIEVGTLLELDQDSDKYYPTITDKYGNLEIDNELVKNNQEYFESLTDNQYEIELKKFEFLDHLEYLTGKDQKVTLNEIEIRRLVDTFFKSPNILYIPNTNGYPNIQTLPHIDYNPKNNLCPSCGSDGTVACGSTVCPKRLIITYGTGEWNSTSTTNYKDEDVKE